VYNITGKEPMKRKGELAENKNKLKLLEKFTENKSKWEEVYPSNYPNFCGAHMDCDCKDDISMAEYKRYRNESIRLKSTVGALAKHKDFKDVKNPY
jgi:hypothetical protein